MRVLVVNGPNLNLLGTRRPQVYGSTTLTELEELCRRWGAEVGIEVGCFQSNHEGALIDRLHAARSEVDGIVINPGALTHTSYALHDAIEAIELPVVETHISNVEEREEWRRSSRVRAACVHTIYGRGVDGYRWALRHLAHRAAWPATVVSYGSGPDQFGDLRLPDSPGPHPALLVIHGGFWRHQWTRDTTEAIAIDAARRGLASFNVEYRRVGTGGTPITMVDDVVAAGRRLAEIEGIDRTRLALIGHSAGGHLALLAAPLLHPTLVVSLAGVTDLVRAVDDGLGHGAAAGFLQGERAARFSPRHLLPLGVPIVLAHGAADLAVPADYSRSFDEAARVAGDQVETLTKREAGHFEYLDPGHQAWKAVAEAIVARL